MKVFYSGKHVGYHHVPGFRVGITLQPGENDVLPKIGAALIAEGHVTQVGNAPALVQSEPAPEKTDEETVGPFRRRRRTRSTEDNSEE